ncbi:MAG: hypothetical protein R3C58_02110 [Parvularculaceae bacterium]
MKRVLFAVTTRDDAAHVDTAFARSGEVGAVEPCSARRVRRYALYDISGYHGR